MNEPKEKKESIEPILQYAILCDATAKDQSGKPVYIGAFDRLTKPIILPQFVVVLKWICGVGSHNFKFKIYDPDLGVLRTFDEFKMEFKRKTDIVNLEYPIMNFHFEKVGVYWIEIILNNESYLSIPLPVHQQ